MSRFFGLVVIALVLAGLAPAPAQACTVTVNCYPACDQELDCNVGPPCYLFCSYPALTLSCTGTTSCNGTANSVQCDSQPTQTCTATPICSKTSSSIRCGSVSKFCSIHGNICPK
jgi:hypothetical protein